MSYLIPNLQRFKHGCRASLRREQQYGLSYLNSEKKMAYKFYNIFPMLQESSYMVTVQVMVHLKTVNVGICNLAKEDVSVPVGRYIM